MVASSMHRVAEQTADHVNKEIHRKTEMHIAYYREHPDQIDQRLRELEQEWDVERDLETGASCLSLFGLVMGLRRSRWLLLPLVVQGFFLQHAIQGWCPPVEVFRRLGFREQSEIAKEYHALKDIAGDKNESSRGRAKAPNRKEQTEVV